MFNKINKVIENQSNEIAYKLKNVIQLSGLTEYYIAGGCFQMEVIDYDLFPVNKNDFDCIKSKLQKYIEFESKNAITIYYFGIRIQFCKYFHNSLKELVDSFDFSHCQIGAKIKNDIVDEIYYSENYAVWKFTNEDSYIHSEYPLSSLIRTFKYKDRFLNKNYKKIVIQILTDIIQRGYKDYDDFKDQLDAIDLGYIKEEEEALNLFHILKNEISSFESISG